MARSGIPNSLRICRLNDGRNLSVSTPPCIRCTFFLSCLEPKNVSCMVVFRATIAVDNLLFTFHALRSQFMFFFTYTYFAPDALATKASEKSEDQLKDCHISNCIGLKSFA